MSSVSQIRAIYIEPARPTRNRWKCPAPALVPFEQPRDPVDNRARGVGTVNLDNRIISCHRHYDRRRGPRVPQLLGV